MKTLFLSDRIFTEFSQGELIESLAATEQIRRLENCCGMSRVSLWKQLLDVLLADARNGARLAICCEAVGHRINLAVNIFFASANGLCSFTSHCMNCHIIFLLLLFTSFGLTAPDSAPQSTNLDDCCESFLECVIQDIWMPSVTVQNDLVDLCRSCDHVESQEFIAKQPVYI